MSHTFVNYLGHPLAPSSSIAPPKKAASAETLKRVDDRDKAKESCGFVVTGFRPEAIKAAEVTHTEAREKQLRRQADGTLGKAEKVAPEWDLRAYLAHNRAPRLRTKPYELRSAADQCADMARNAGFIAVNVSEILRG